MHSANASLLSALRTATLITVALALGACSAIDNLMQGDKINYKSKATKTAPLDVPPDLTQLQRDGRYQPQASGTISASTFAATAGTATSGAASEPAATSSGTVARNAIGRMRIVRDGNQRWLAVPIAADALWPQLRDFWKERGFTLVVDTPEAGVMETDWAENRAKIPQDVIRRTIGRVFDSIYDSGERDRFRVRVERNIDGGSDIFITHRGMVEVYTDQQRKDQTVWTQRPSDPQLEAEMLSRLLVKLGAKEEVARSVVATADTPAPNAPRARIVGTPPSATVQVDEGFDRAWRRVGLALDRSGFTVEDRDRASGLYFVRYIDPKIAAAGEPNFFAKLFSFGKSKEGSGPGRYRVALKADGERTNVAVQNAQGGPETSEIGRRIASLLVDELK